MHAAGEDGRTRAPALATRAGPVAHVADVAAGVLERAAAATEPRVRGVLGRGQRYGAVLDAEEHHLAARHLAELRHRGVVGVEHKRRPTALRLERVPPAVRNGVDLAVAVELVAEEVE